MKRNLYQTVSLLFLSVIGYGQGSQINGTTQVYSPAYYGVYGTLTFNSGYLITPRTNPNSNVYFTTASASAGQSDGSHINGYAEKEGTTAFTFPIGDGTTLRPAGISAPASSARFQAAYFKVDPSAATLPSGAPFPTANKGTGVNGVSTVEYWDVNGSVSTNLMLTWNATSDLVTLTSNTPGNLIIVGYNPSTSKWENLGNAGGTTGTLASSGSITANGVTPNTYTAFTFGSQALQPDLTPVTYVLPATQYGTTNFTVVVDVFELLNVATNGLVTVHVSKDPLVNLSFDSGSSLVGGRTVQNSIWTIDNSDPDFYIFTTSQVVPASSKISFGMTGVLTPGNTRGTLTLSTAIVGGSGGEVRTDNNTDADNVDYFNK